MLLLLWEEQSSTTAMLFMVYGLGRIEKLRHLAISSLPMDKLEQQQTRGTDAKRFEAGAATRTG